MINLISFLKLLNAFVAFCLLGIAINKRLELPLYRQISNLTSALGFWNLIHFFDLTNSNFDHKLFFASFYYAAIALSALFLFYFALAYCMPRMPTIYMYLFAIIPIITCTLSITSVHHSWFLVLDKTYTNSSLLYIPWIYKPWFFVHAGYSYILIFLSCALFLRKSFSHSVKNRKEIILLTVATISFAIVNVIYTFFSKSTPVQYAVILTHFICINIFYFSATKDTDEAVLLYGQKDFFHTFDAPIFLFNNYHELLQFNNNAKMYFEKLNLNLTKYLKYEEVFSEKKFTKTELLFSKDSAITFYLQHIETNTVFYCRTTKITEPKSQTLIGESIILFSTEILSPIIKKLEKTAYIDSLCGCFNRLSFDTRKYELIEKSTHPILLLLADIDNLKKVNDAFGHSAGDEYIKTCVSILKKITRSTDLIFRIGGDEFAIFFPAFDASVVSKLRGRIERSCKNQIAEYPVSMSIGVSIIHDKNESFDEHFNLADSDLYIQKQKHKKIYTENN